jgi:succinate dehydrogenase / fumarate reductase cytochrome b subunit
MTRIGNALASSVGRKVVLGATGLLLVLFLVEHLHGNLKLYEDRDGQAFGRYVSLLQGFGPLLLVAELGLAALFLAHVYLALRLTLENLQARRTRYVIRNNCGASTLASTSMFYSGALLLGYLLKHLYDFRFDRRFFTEPAALVGRTLSQPGHALVYLVAAAVLGLHLSHGFRSAFQSLGISHPRWNLWLERLGILVALVFALGFGSFPIYYLFFWSEGSAP